MLHSGRGLARSPSFFCSKGPDIPDFFSLCFLFSIHFLTFAARTGGIGMQPGEVALRTAEGNT